MTLLGSSLAGLAIAAGSGAIGAAIGATVAETRVQFWRLRAEQQLRRLRAMRSDGRETELLPIRHGRHWHDAHQQTHPPG